MLDGASGVKQSERNQSEAERYFKRPDGNYCKQYKALG
jgi:hypothetical protein